MNRDVQSGKSLRISDREESEYESIRAIDMTLNRPVRMLNGESPKNLNSRFLKMVVWNMLMECYLK